MNCQIRTIQCKHIRLAALILASIATTACGNSKKENPNKESSEIHGTCLVVVGEDYEQTKSACEQGCERGDLVSCRRLGQIWDGTLWGELTNKIDNDKAREFYEKSCGRSGSGESIDAIGCYRLGRMLFDKNKEKANLVRSKESFLQACDNGNGAGCFGLAIFSFGLDRDIVTAKKYLQKARELKYGPALDKPQELINRPEWSMYANEYMQIYLSSSSQKGDVNTDSGAI